MFHANSPDNYCNQMPDEQAFCLLVRLMHTYDLRGHFLPEMPKLQLRLVRSIVSVSCSPKLSQFQVPSEHARYAIVLSSSSLID